MKSPFDDLHIDRALVSEFFATFARFEYAMKARGFCRRDRFGNALPDWNELKGQLGGPISAAVTSCETSAYLLEEPPQVQKYVGGYPEFKAVSLAGATVGAQALEAAKRVRNNLFHGGKHTPHSSPERDTRLIRGALNVLDACLKANANLQTEFEQQVF